MINRFVFQGTIYGEKSMLLSLVVPCYNEEENVEPLYRSIKGAFQSLQMDYEIICVNDGSKDRTIQELRELHRQDPEHVAVIGFSRNFGKEAAVLAGLKRSKGDYVAIIDADLQQKPELVVQMLDILEKSDEYDCVAAYQENRQEGRFIRFCKSNGYKLMNKVCETEFYTGASDFRVMRRIMVDAILSMPEYYRFSKGIFSWVGFPTYYMPYTAEKRHAGESKWGFKKLLKYGMEGFFSFSTFPLKIASYIGSVTSVMAIVYLIIVVIQKLAFSIDIPGYPTIIVLILFLGGVQLLILGIIGEYLARAYIQGKNRPIYIEREYYETENECRRE